MTIGPPRRTGGHQNSYTNRHAAGSASRGASAGIAGSWCSKTLRQRGRGGSRTGIDRGVVFQDYSLFPGWASAGMSRARAGVSGQARRRATGVGRGVPGAGGAPGRLPEAARSALWRDAAAGRHRQGLRGRRAGPADGRAVRRLDAITRARLQDLLLDLWHQGGAERRKTILFVTHDVEEALLLAGRVVVLGSRPGRIRETVEIDLPRPRVRGQLFTHKEYQGLRDRLLALLHEDVLQALVPNVGSPGECI